MAEYRDRTAQPGAAAFRLFRSSLALLRRVEAANAAVAGSISFVEDFESGWTSMLDEQRVLEHGVDPTNAEFVLDKEEALELGLFRDDAPVPRANAAGGSGQARWLAFGRAVGRDRGVLEVAEACLRHLARDDYYNQGWADQVSSAIEAGTVETEKILRLLVGHNLVRERSAGFFVADQRHLRMIKEIDFTAR
ncbi:MAG: hypothetical protein RIF41_09395 [Polyangiaceae bacterium]